jgi:hypothetical protein
MLFSRVADPDPNWIWIQSGRWIRSDNKVRIRIKVFLTLVA